MVVRRVDDAAEVAALARELAGVEAWPEPTHFSRGAASAWTRALDCDWEPAAMARRCEASAALRSLRVDVQAASEEAPFSGDEALRRDISLKLSSVLSLCEARGRRGHWLREATGEDFYLAQAPLFGISDGACVVEPLCELVVDGAGRRDAAARVLGAVPPFARSGSAAGRGATGHLWLAPGAVSSAPHCDEDHNVLTVLAGRKRVALLSPRRGAEAWRARAPWTASPNHCGAPFAAATAAPVVTLEAGEALLIPAGWYHAVASEAATSAVNVWWPPRTTTPGPRATRPAAAARALFPPDARDRPRLLL